MTRAQRRRARVPSLPASVLVLLLAAGCAGGDGGAGSGSRATATLGAGAASTASVEGCEPVPPLPSEYATFAPQDAPTEPTGEQLTAVLETTCGDVTVELEGASAPQTVASFELLAGEDYWADSPCHRVTTEGIWVLQCGDPTGTGRGGPGYTYGIENAPPDGYYPRGTLAMARSSDPESNGGQFFIVYRDTELPVEGGGYTVFGRVTDGMDIIDRVAAAGVDGGGADGQPAQPISLLDVRVTDEKA